MVEGERNTAERVREMRDGGKGKSAVCIQSVPGRVAENSGHVGPCETFCAGKGKHRWLGSLPHYCQLGIMV